MNKILKKFNKLIFESIIDSSSYHFSSDKNGNIFCTFTLGDKYVVTAKKFNEVFSFDLTDNSGNTKTLSQKHFSVEYADYYDEFKKKMNAYVSSDFQQDYSQQNKSLIKPFHQQLNDQENFDQNVLDNHDIKIQNKIFNFKLLKDLMVSNYCQCIFQFFDQRQNQTRGVKSLLSIRQKNSIIIKSILQNQKGETLFVMSEIDFKQQFPDIYQQFITAIKKYEEYYYNKY